MVKIINKIILAVVVLLLLIGNQYMIISASNNFDEINSNRNDNTDISSGNSNESNQNRELDVNGNQSGNIKQKNENEIIGQTKFVDENGNITTVDVYDGTTGEVYNPRLRVVSTANMVNFNCSTAGTTTEFVDYYTGQTGYISKASAADAAFLGYENGKVKFMISGVTGLVDPSKVEV